MMANPFGIVVYVLCAATSALCAALLVRGYRQSGARLLFWSALCFIGFALNNLLLIVDAQHITRFDLLTVRILPALAGVIVLLYGLIWETR
jgi:hypothetical protein